MEDNTNELLGISENNSQNPNFTIFDYSTYRDAFWKKRYPVSQILYILSMAIGWILLGISVLFGVTVAVGQGGPAGGFMIAIGVVGGFILLFISETLLFQIDKNFFAYMEIHKKLELLKGNKSSN